MQSRDTSSSITPANKAKYTGSKIEMRTFLPVRNFTSGLSALGGNQTSGNQTSGSGDNDALDIAIKDYDELLTATRVQKRPVISEPPYKSDLTSNPVGVNKGKEIVDGWKRSATPTPNPSKSGRGTGSSEPKTSRSNSFSSLESISSDLDIVNEGYSSSELTHPLGSGQVTNRPIAKWAGPDSSTANSSRPKTAPVQRTKGLGSTTARPSSANSRLETAEDGSTDGSSISRQNSETGAALIFPETREYPQHSARHQSGRSLGRVVPPPAPSNETQVASGAGNEVMSPGLKTIQTLQGQLMAQLKKDPTTIAQAFPKQPVKDIDVANFALNSAGPNAADVKTWFESQPPQVQQNIMRGFHEIADYINRNRALLTGTQPPSGTDEHLRVGKGFIPSGPSGSDITWTGNSSFTNGRSRFEFGTVSQWKPPGGNSPNNQRKFWPLAESAIADLAQPKQISYPRAYPKKVAAELKPSASKQAFRATEVLPPSQPILANTSELHKRTLEATSIVAHATARLQAQFNPPIVLPESWKTSDAIPERQILLTTVKDTITKVSEHSQQENVFTPKQLNHLKCIVNFQKSLARYENGKGSDVAFLALMRSTLGHLDQILDTKVPGVLTVSPQDLAETASNTVFEALQPASERPYSNLAIRSDTRHKAAIYTILYGGEHKPVEPKGVIHTEVEGDMNGGSYQSSVASSGTSTPSTTFEEDLTEDDDFIPDRKLSVSQVELDPTRPLNSGISGDQFREIFDVYYSCSTFKPDFETHVLSSHFDVISDAVDAVVEIHHARPDDFFAFPVETKRPTLAPPTTIKEWVGQVNEHLKGTDPQRPPIQLPDPEYDTEWQTASNVTTFRDNQFQQLHGERHMLRNLFHSQLRFDEEEDDA